MHLSRAKSISARTDRALNRFGGARRSQVLTLSGEKMGFESTLEGFERRGEPGKEWQRIPNLRSSNSECSGANASSGCARSCCLYERNDERAHTVG